MSKNRNQENFRQFIPAQLSTHTAERFVYYSVINPANGKMNRKKIKINRIKKSEQKKYAEYLMREINQKLYAGWNPFMEERASQGMTNIIIAINKFINQKSKELKDHSMRSYNSYTRIFIEWTKYTGVHQDSVLSINSDHAIAFMHYIYNEKNVGANTYNNYRNFFKLLWNWMISHNFAEQNIFEKIQRKKSKEKERGTISQDERTKIADYFKGKDYNMYIACLLIYHTLIRPNELTYLKVEHFNLKDQVITIPAHAAKANKSRITTIPNSLISELIKWNYDGAKEYQYIYGKGFCPGKERIDPKRFAKKWAKMRSELKMPMTCKLYSLRDSGIIDLLHNDVPADEVMKQAGHSSLEMTTIYTRHFNNKGSIEVKEKAKKF